MTAATLITIIARMARLRPDEIHEQAALTSLGLRSSFGLSALRSAVEATTKRKLPSLKGSMSVGDLIKLAGGEALPATPAPATAPARPPAPARAAATPVTRTSPGFAMPANFNIGLDMQEVAVFPLTDDFRTHEFYAAHFSAAEIATAILRPLPRQHFCGLFCAKEAVKKSHPRLLDIRMGDLYIDHAADGRPTVRIAEHALADCPFQFRLSITHTELFSAAVCLTVWNGN